MPSTSRSFRARDPGRPLRLGSGAGFAGDRIEPARALAEHGALDVLVFECLAERTIALAQLRRRQDPDAGFDPLLEARMRAVLPACARQGITVIGNFGAANPSAAGALVQRVARELGLPGLRIAVVGGDDVLDWVRANDTPLLADPRRSGELGDALVSANAYLGADALLPALAGGADVVVTGRVADPSLFVAPLMHHFGWAADDWPRLGAGVLVGHLLECAAQVSGGYIAEPGRYDVPDLHALGFPWAEVQADGRATIGKLAGTGGRIDRVSCTAQLLYEIEDPAAYRQADVVADFSGVRLDAAGTDRVQVHGATGRVRPDRLKATLGLRDGFIGEGQISYAGPGAVARGRLAIEVLERRLAALDLGALEHRLELIGMDAMHGPRLGSDREPYEVRVRLAARCTSSAQAQRIVHEVDALYLNGPAGGGGVVGGVREVIAAASVLVPRDAARPTLRWLES